jgi:hypothetical protein
MRAHHRKSPETGVHCHGTMDIDRLRDVLGGNMPQHGLEFRLGIVVPVATYVGAVSLEVFHSRLAISQKRIHHDQDPIFIERTGTALKKAPLVFMVEMVQRKLCEDDIVSFLVTDEPRQEIGLD